MDKTANGKGNRRWSAYRGGNPELLRLPIPHASIVTDAGHGNHLPREGGLKLCKFCANCCCLRKAANQPRMQCEQVRQPW